MYVCMYVCTYMAQAYVYVTVIAKYYNSLKIGRKAELAYAKQFFIWVKYRR